MVKDRKQKSGDFWKVLQRKEPESPGSRSCSPPCPSWFLLLCMKTWWPMYCQPSFLVRGPQEWKPHAGSDTEEPGGPAYTDATKSFCALASAPVQWSFAAPPRERWSHLLHPLNLAWGVSGAEWGEWAVLSVVLLDVECPSLSGKRRVYLQGRWLSLKLEISYIWKDHIINCTKENVSQVCCCCRELPIQKLRELGWTLWCGSGQVCGCKLVVFSTH